MSLLKENMALSALKIVGAGFDKLSVVFHRILDFTRGWISIRPFYLQKRLLLFSGAYRTFGTYLKRALNGKFYAAG
jgi:hypothetical protein